MRFYSVIDFYKKKIDLFKLKIPFFLILIGGYGFLFKNDVHAGLKDKYKEQLSCDLETAQYSYKDQRLCIQNDGQVISINSDGVRNKLLGFVNRKETGTSILLGYNIWEWSIEDNKLVQYYCSPAEDEDFKCLGTVRKNITAFNIQNNQFKKVLTKVSANLDKRPGYRRLGDIYKDQMYCSYETADYKSKSSESRYCLLNNYKVLIVSPEGSIDRALGFLNQEEKATHFLYGYNVWEWVKEEDQLIQYSCPAYTDKNNFDCAGSVNKNVVAYKQEIKPKVLAKRFMKLENYPGAVAAYNKAIELDPENEELIKDRANARSKTGDKEGAIEDLSKVITLIRKNRTTDVEKHLKSAYLSICQEKINSNLYLEAINDCKTVIDLDYCKDSGLFRINCEYDSVIAYRKIAIAYFPNDKEKALENINKGLRIHTQDPMSLWIRAEIKLSQGKDIKDACKDLNDAKWYGKDNKKLVTAINNFMKNNSIDCK